MKLARIFHEFTAPSLVFMFRMEILFRRAYESLRRSFTKFPYETKSCAIITAIHEISGPEKAVGGFVGANLFALTNELCANKFAPTNAAHRMDKRSASTDSR